MADRQANISKIQAANQRAKAFRDAMKAAGIQPISPQAAKKQGLPLAKQLKIGTTQRRAQKIGPGQHMPVKAPGTPIPGQFLRVRPGSGTSPFAGAATSVGTGTPPPPPPSGGTRTATAPTGKGSKLARRKEDLPKLKAGHIRITHHTSAQAASAIEQNGLDYSKYSMAQSTARAWNKPEDVEFFATDPRFGQPGQKVVVLDVPAKEWKLHNDVQKAPGLIPAKHVVGIVDVEPVPPGITRPSVPTGPPSLTGQATKKLVAPSITSQPTKPQVVGGNIPRAKTQPLLGSYGPQQAQLKAAKQQEAGVKPVPKVQQYMVDAEAKARQRKADEVAKYTAIERLAQSAEGIPQDTTAYLGSLPAPGGIALPLLLLIVLFLLILPAQGADGTIHTRAMWLWRVMTSNASLQQTSRSFEGTITPGVISAVAGTTEQVLQAEAKVAHDIFTYPLHELGLVQ